MDIQWWAQPKPELVHYTPQQQSIQALHPRLQQYIMQLERENTMLKQIKSQPQLRLNAPIDYIKPPPIDYHTPIDYMKSIDNQKHADFDFSADKRLEYQMPQQFHSFAQQPAILTTKPNISVYKEAYHQPNRVKQHRPQQVKSMPTLPPLFPSHSTITKQVTRMPLLTSKGQGLPHSELAANKQKNGQQLQIFHQPPGRPTLQHIATAPNTAMSPRTLETLSRRNLWKESVGERRKKLKLQLQDPKLYY